MPFRYVRRYRMEFNLLRTPLPEARLPVGYRWLRWDTELVHRHAAVKHVSFREELDALVFQCFNDVDGCRRLMQDIARQETFLPQATWLVAYEATRNRVPVDCGTVQGLAGERGAGSVQNVGVVPEHRGLGLGRALVARALEGFRAAGCRRVTLEVTAENEPAVDLYRSLGFLKTRTLYKEVAELPVAVLA